jgi:hypothetical protein
VPQSRSGVASSGAFRHDPKLGSFLQCWLWSKKPSSTNKNSQQTVQQMANCASAYQGPYDSQSTHGQVRVVCSVYACCHYNRCCKPRICFGWEILLESLRKHFQKRFATSATMRMKSRSHTTHYRQPLSAAAVTTRACSISSLAKALDDAHWQAIGLSGPGFPRISSATCRPGHLAGPAQTACQDEHQHRIATMSHR